VNFLVATKTNTTANISDKIAVEYNETIDSALVKVLFNQVAIFFDIYILYKIFLLSVII
jgi:hypothetical protein